MLWLFTLPALPAAQVASLPARPGAADGKVEAIIITARPQDGRDKIDRRTYDVRTDPAVAGMGATDVLSRLPSVTVSPAGRVALRGDPGVVVMIDGKVPANGTSALQALPSSSITKVEIMTNPSAQFAPEGTAGVINIITRKPTVDTLTGTLTARINSLGDINLSSSADLKRNGWAVASRLSLNRNESKSDGDALQTSAVNGNPITQRQDRGVTALDSSLVNLSVTRAALGRGDLTLEVQNLEGTIDGVTLSTFDVWANGTNDRLVETKTLRSDTRQTNLNGTYSEKWPDDHGSLEASIDHGVTRQRNQVHFVDRPAGASLATTDYTTTLRTSGSDDEAKIAMVANLAGPSILSFGGAANRTKSSIARAYSGQAIGGTDDTGVFDGRRSRVSGYATYQFPLAGLLIMPGMRIEFEDLAVASPLASHAKGATRLFPSLHTSRPLGGGKLKASYSRRISRPSLSLYDERRTLVSVGRFRYGNAELKPTTSDSFEISYETSAAGALMGASIYLRVSHDPWQDFTTARNDGTLLTTPINYDRTRSGGVEFTSRGGSFFGFGYSASLNIFYQELILLSNAHPSSTGRLTFSGNATIEKKFKNGDRYQAFITGTGRSQTIQGHQAAYSQVDLNYSHNLTPSVVLSAGIVDLFNANRFRVVTFNNGAVIRASTEPNTRAVKMAIVYKFGQRR
ncbi:TonB-dependent receptor [Caulobacter vibrioides]|nr:TonB-dependent receptor [Caulobacter vibrioides]